MTTSKSFYSTILFIGMFAGNPISQQSVSVAVFADIDGWTKTGIFKNGNTNIDHFYAKLQPLTFNLLHQNNSNQ